VATKRLLNALAAVLNTLSGWLLLLPFVPSLVGLPPQLSLPILYGMIFSNPLALLLLWAGHSYPESRYDYLYWAGKVVVFSVYTTFVFRFFFPLHGYLLTLRGLWLFLNPVLHGLTAAVIALNPKWYMSLLSPTFWKPFGTPPKVNLTPEDFLVSGLAYAALGSLHLWLSLNVAREVRKPAPPAALQKEEAPPQEEPHLAAGGGEMAKEVVPGRKPSPFLPPDPKPQVVDRKRRLEILKRALEGAELEEGLDLERVVKLSAHLSEAALDERVRMARFRAEAMGRPLTFDLLKRALEKK